MPGSTSAAQERTANRVLGVLLSFAGASRLCVVTRSLRHRAPLLWLVVPFVAGLAAGEACEGAVATKSILALALAGALASAVVADRSPRGWALLLCGSLGLAGAAAYALHRVRLPDWQGLPAREAVLSLRIERVFSSNLRNRASGLARVTRAEPHLADLIGQRMYFSVTLDRGAAPPLRSTILSTIGVLTLAPASPPANSFDGYLANAGVNFKLTRARIVAVEQPASRYHRFCAGMARRFRQILNEGIAARRPELAALLRGMMLGEIRELNEDQRTVFMQSGTMHLFAISGLNIGVIAATMQALLSLTRMPRWARFAIGTVLLWLFVDITGGSPSAVRAFVMAAFLHAAFVLHRPANLLAALLASAALVLACAPLQFFSTSFLMSYSIVAALLVLGLPLADVWQERWRLWPHLPTITWERWRRVAGWAWQPVPAALAVSVATTLVTVLTGIQFFGLITPGGMLANLILIPAAAGVTVAGFTALLCGLVGLTAVAALCNFAAALLLLWIETLIRWSVKLPGAFMPAHFAAPWIGPAALAVLLIILLHGYAVDWRRERGGWWPPFVFVGVVLAFGVKFGK